MKQTFAKQFRNIRANWYTSVYRQAADSVNKPVTILNKQALTTAQMPLAAHRPVWGMLADFCAERTKALKHVPDLGFYRHAMQMNVQIGRALPATKRTAFAFWSLKPKEAA
ncbi:hypothetical protein [Maritalea mediterranea]|uniref:Uncharacterized protein n=1 Tax=Maritalea mediterranea TaxID=2909667 RepID=A0ABS9E8Z6_9HYPH|nr:hypothetical protein [Maritalea mediterranea]MCF4099317.1 hypothetical protein [Maritalea mediterranea]